MPWHLQKRTKDLSPEIRKYEPWSPPALRWWNLLLAACISWFFIGLLQFMLNKSIANDGIIFATNISDIPLRRSFAYLYLPTVCAVIFSIYCAWIDLDAKRFEPYYQLAKPNGALGKDSLLLHYPFDFIPIVPFIALKNRHWLVLWASTAMVLTNFGIVPLQAGIFSTEKVKKTYSQDFLISHKFINASKQASELGLGYLDSVYGFLNLNATLPPYMTRNYTLAPFTVSGPEIEPEGTWTANTTLFGLDLTCEVPKQRYEEQGAISVYESSTGCLYNLSATLWNASIYTSEEAQSVTYPAAPTKEFSITYSGPDDTGVVGEMFPATKECPHTMENAWEVFFASFIQHRPAGSDQPNNITVIYCEPSYYEQPVQATVDAVTRSPLQIATLASKQPLRPEFLNRYGFLYTGQDASLKAQPYNGRPFYRPPTYADRLIDSSLDLANKQGTYAELILPWAAMAVVAGGHQVPDYLRAQNLEEAYRRAYRLAYASAMTQVLQTDFSNDTVQLAGQRSIELEAVALDPVFTYIVEGLLGFVSVSVIALLVMRVKSRNRDKLLSDPGTISAIMGLTADQEPLLSSFQDLDRVSTAHLNGKFGNHIYKLSKDESRLTILGVTRPGSSCDSECLIQTERQEGRAIRPAEFSFLVGIPFVGLFITLTVALAVLFAKNKAYGLPLPSTSRFVQSLAREYVPTAVATMIEPMWILINRLLCMLQPMEELRTMRASPSRSIDLNYSSLPPQLTIFKTLRAKHFLLSLVCVMALLANVLAAAFAGLLYQDTIPLAKATAFPQLLQPNFVSLDGKLGPSVSSMFELDNKRYSGAFQGETGDDHFIVNEANLTQHTPLPPWTDSQSMYLPFDIPQGSGKASSTMTYRARTGYIRAELVCERLTPGVDYFVEMVANYQPGYTTIDAYFEGRAGNAFNISHPNSGSKVVCQQYDGPNPGSNAVGGSYASPPSYLDIVENGVEADPCKDGPFAWEYMAPLEPYNDDPTPRNFTREEVEPCMSAAIIGWMRMKPDCNKKDTINADDYEVRENGTAENSLILACRPKLTMGEATIVVNSDGVLQESAKGHTDGIEIPEENFANGTANLLGQANLYMFRSIKFGFHKSPFAVEAIHYFTNREADNDLRFTDPKQPIPKFSDVEEPLKKAYSKLFAIWLGLNKDRLLVNVSDPSQTIIGETITMEERIFFKKHLFVLAETILGVYVLVSILVYAKRPGRYLPRMPTTIASQIALFAASSAVRDFKGTSLYTERERVRNIEDLDRRYGYGSFVSVDGKVHVGIERAPFVEPVPRSKTNISKFKNLCWVRTGPSESKHYPTV